MNFFRRMFMAERLLDVAHGQAIVIAEQRAIITALHFEMEKPIPEMPLDPKWNFGANVAIAVESKAGASWGSLK